MAAVSVASSAGSGCPPDTSRFVLRLATSSDACSRSNNRSGSRSAALAVVPGSPSARPIPTLLKWQTPFLSPAFLCVILRCGGQEQATHREGKATQIKRAPMCGGDVAEVGWPSLGCLSCCTAGLAEQRTTRPMVCSVQHTHGHGAGLGKPVLHGVLECLSSGYRRWRHPTLWRLCVTPVPCLHTPSRCPSPTSVR